MFRNKKVIFYQLGLEQIGETYIYHVDNNDIFRNLMRIKDRSSSLYVYLHVIYTITKIK